MAQQGWVKIHRKLRECYLWDDKEPFDKRSAWIDILLSANHADKKTLINNQAVLVKRGSFITSEIKLSERWKWDRGKTRRFLKLLENDNMIKKIVTSKLYITVEIVNYEIYQSATSESIDNTDVEVDNTTSNKQVENKYATSNEQVTNINKNDKELNKNSKNEKKDINKIHYAEFVTLTEDEYSKLIEQYGEKLIKEKIIDLNLWKGSKGKKTKSDYMTLLTWIRKDNKETKITYKTNKPSGWSLENERPMEAGLEEKLLQSSREENTEEDYKEMLKKTRQGG